MSANSFTVQRNDIRSVHRIDDGARTAPLSAGAARFRVTAFGLTSNNVTYAAMGDSLGYFGFYPTGDQQVGRIPVWGFADVVESHVPEVREGERFFGYFPASSHAVLQPTAVTDRGFLEGSEHRQGRPRIYNNYARTATDPLYRPEDEGILALLRPVFSTGFIIDDFLAEKAFFGAEAVIVSSASSKTAYSTAFFLSRRLTRPRIIGLTSRKNHAFVSRLGCYDEIVLYDDVAGLAANPAVYLDIAGDAALRARIHHQFGERLTYSSIIGATHWSARGVGEGLPGPAPSPFPTVAHLQRRIAELGPAAVGDRLGGAWQAFRGVVTDPVAPWLRIVRAGGLDAVLQTYQSLLDGAVPADEGHLLYI